MDQDAIRSNISITADNASPRSQLILIVNASRVWALINPIYEDVAVKVGS